MQPQPKTLAHRALMALAAVMVCSSGTNTVWGQRPITDLVPADVLFVITSKPFDTSHRNPDPTSPEDPEAGRPSDDKPTPSIASILSILNALGLIPNEGQVYADIAASLPLLGRFEHALILLDASTRPKTSPTDAEHPPATGRPVSLRLHQLQAAIVFRTAGRHRLVIEHLNRAVGRYTNNEVATLTNKKVGNADCQRLVDRRLPDWAVCQWGRLGDFFVIAFGEGAFERIAETYSIQRPSLHRDAWFRAAMKKTLGDDALVSWFIHFTQIENRLAPLTGGRYQQVVTALDARGLRRDLWTVGLDGRAMTWFRCYECEAPSSGASDHRPLIRPTSQEPLESRDVVRRYSDPKAAAPTHRRIVPDAARHYAIIDAPTPWIIRNLPAAWLASQSEGNRDKWRRIWRYVEEETGVDINGNLLQHLGRTVILHDYPRHPLGVPFALTAAIEIDDARPVRLALDALLGHWGRYLDERAEMKGTTLVRVKVLRDDDGVWYLQAGILGPALKVTDRYILISWSPAALREAERFLAGPAQQKPALRDGRSSSEAGR